MDYPGGLMQINFHQNNSQSFQGIQLHAEEVLKKVLNQKDWTEFSKIIDEQNQNNMADIILWGQNGTNRLLGRVLENSTEHKLKKSLIDYTQHFWESHIGFIKKLAKRANKMKAQLEELPNSQDIESILKKTKQA